MNYNISIGKIYKVYSTVGFNSISLYTVENPPSIIEDKNLVFKIKNGSIIVPLLINNNNGIFNILTTNIKVLTESGSVGWLLIYEDEYIFVDEIFDQE